MHGFRKEQLHADGKIGRKESSIKRKNQLHLESPSPDVGVWVVCLGYKRVEAKVLISRKGVYGAGKGLIITPA